MLDRLNLGVIGCGHVSENNHIPVILGTDFIKINWIFDINEHKSNIVSNKFNLPTTKLLVGNNINSLLLAVPVMNRNEYYKFIVKNKLSAFIEKPAFKNYQDYLTLSKDINEHQIITHFGYNRRFYQNINYLKKILNKNIFGDIKSIKISEGSSPNRL